MTAQLLDTQVSLDGLLEVLGKNLYSTPAVAIRELVQNAHDACYRRQFEQGITNHSYRIDLATESDGSVLYIEDNGSGLTDQEIIDYLATVGSGYTRVLREQNANEQMIGYFGLGFLSAYVVADKVDVWTCSYQTPNKYWHFSSRGGKRYTLAACEQKPVGTKVRLQLKDEFKTLGDSLALDELLAKYCCLLPTAIHLNNSAEAINDLQAPWLIEQQVSPIMLTKKRLAFAKRFENQFEPICTIPIPPDNAAGLNGLIWIQDAGGFATSDFRNVNVFIRNMHISHKERELLPSWAGFVGCIIETTQLVPTASREDIQQDQNYQLAQQALSRALIDGLKHIAKHEEPTWRRIIARHDQALLGAAIGDDQLFELLSPELKLPTNMGKLTIEQLLVRSNGRIYLRYEDKLSYEDILFKAKMLPVVSGYLFAAAQFCLKYAQLHPIKIIEVGKQTDDTALFKPVQISETEQQKLQQLLGQSGDEFHISQFEPIELPMVIVEDSQVKLKQRIESDEQDKKLGSAALMLAKLHTDKIDAKIKRRVYINMDCPLIGQLQAFECPDKAQTFAQLLRSFMTIMGHDSEDKTLDFGAQLRTFSQSLQSIGGH